MGTAAVDLDPCQLASHFKAAGVLPFAFNQSKAHILLGAELKKTGPGGQFYRTMCRFALQVALLTAWMCPSLLPVQSFIRHN